VGFFVLVFFLVCDRFSEFLAPDFVLIVVLTRFRMAILHALEAHVGCNFVHTHCARLYIGYSSRKDQMDSKLSDLNRSLLVIAEKLLLSHIPSLLGLDLNCVTIFQVNNFRLEFVSYKAANHIKLISYKDSFI